MGINPNRILTMILAGGEGRRLQPLTLHRAKPAVPFGARYRIVDFVLSNFVNSGFYKIKILSQYKSDSLIKHVTRGYRFNSQFGFFIDFVPAQMRKGPDWYKGSADAIFQSLHIITDENPDHVIVFGADHIYKMDVRQMLLFHQAKGADISITAIPVPIEEAHRFGVMEVNKDGRLIGFAEKPHHPAPMPNDPTRALVSMGNYIFNTDTLLEEIERDSKNKDSVHDFGRSIIPLTYKKRKVFVYDFATNVVPGQSEREQGYWRDVGDLDTYFQTSLDLVSVNPVVDLHNREWPIHTYYKQGPPAKFVFADEKSRRVGIATDSLVSEGCIVSGGHIDRTILSPFVRINSYSQVEESVIFEGVDVGRYARIRRAVIDKFVKIPPHMEIGIDHDKDRERGFTVTAGGITVIPRGTVIE
ncbi:MAG: glucose-1-phosphate adenylyltransferase [Candidatus Lernaella stagnicola]|nr:glucose-1-phosphate adenylyltransferase [Candidatus Lernaella stagnicola]